MKKILILLMCAAIVVQGCNTSKKVTELPTHPNGNQGANADNPIDVAKVPMYTSEAYRQQARQLQPEFAQKGRPPKGDAIFPVITSSSPADNASVSGTVNISFSATDNKALNNLSILLNNVLVKSVSVVGTSASLSYSWVTGADGQYQITFKATDANGNSTPKNIFVTKTTIIIPPPPPPPPQLPSSTILACPPVMAQGSEGSCLAFGHIYQRSIEQYYKTGATSWDSTTNIFSPEFLYDYGKANADCGSGSFMLGNFLILMNKGVCKYASLPYSSQNGCDTSLISNANKSEALNYKITTYRSIYPTDIIALKTQLAAHHPIVFTYQYDDLFYNATPGFIWYKRGATLMGNHGSCIIGYDDNIKATPTSKGAFLMVNSWGTSWGDGGKVWIDYDFFSTISSYDYFEIL